MKKIISIIAAALVGFVVSAEEISIETDKYSVVYESNKEITAENLIDYAGDNYAGDLIPTIKKLFTEMYDDDYFRFVDVIEIKYDNYAPVMEYLEAKAHDSEFAEVAYNAIVSGNEVEAWAGNRGYAMMDWEFFLCYNKSDYHSHLQDGCAYFSKRFVAIINMER